MRGAPIERAAGGWEQSLEIVGRGDHRIGGCTVYVQTTALEQRKGTVCAIVDRLLSDRVGVTHSGRIHQTQQTLGRFGACLHGV